MNTNILNQKPYLLEFNLNSALNSEELEQQFSAHFADRVQLLDFQRPLKQSTVSELAKIAWQYFISQPYQTPLVRDKDVLKIEHLDFMAFVENQCIFQTLDFLGAGRSKQIYDGAVITYDKNSSDQITIKIQV